MDFAAVTKSNLDDFLPKWIGYESKILSLLDKEQQEKYEACGKESLTVWCSVAKHFEIFLNYRSKFKKITIPFHDFANFISPTT